MEIDQDGTNDETVPESVGEASVSSVARINRTKKHTSPVWNYFEKCASERLFSKAGQLISSKCSRIKSKNVDMILFFNNL